MKEGARGLPMAVAVAADMFSLPRSTFGGLYDPAPAPREGLGLLVGLAPGEARAAKREAFMTARRDSLRSVDVCSGRSFLAVDCVGLCQERRLRCSAGSVDPPPP